MTHTIDLNRLTPHFIQKLYNEACDEIIRLGISMPLHDNCFYNEAKALKAAIELEMEQRVARSGSLSFKVMDSCRQWSDLKSQTVTGEQRCSN